MRDISEKVRRILSPAVSALRNEQRLASSLPAEPVFQGTFSSGIEYGLRLVKQLISDLVNLAKSHQLILFSAVRSPSPVLKVFFVSKGLQDALNHGKQYSRVAIPRTGFDPEVHLPRVLREKKMLKNAKILKGKAANVLIYSLLAHQDECAPDSESSQEAEIDHLLSSERLGWVSAGRDKFSLQLYPDLRSLETGLSDLIDLPLLTLANTPQVASTGSRLISLLSIKEKRAEVSLKCRNLLQNSLYSPLALLAIMRQYDYLTQENQSELLFLLIRSHINDYSGLSEEMKTIQKDLEVIQGEYPDSIAFGLVEVDLSLCKKDMVHNGNQLLARLMEELAQEHTGLLNQASQLFGILCQDLKRTPQSVEELRDISEYLDTGQDKKQMKDIKAILSQSVAIQNILDGFRYSLDPRQMYISWLTRTWDAELQKIRTRLVTKLRKIKPQFEEQVRTDSKRLQALGSETESQMSHFDGYSDVHQADTYSDLAKSLLETLRAAAGQISTLNIREKVLNLPLTDLSGFTTAVSDFAKHSQLWSFASDWVTAWREWHFQHFRLIDPVAVARKSASGLVLLQSLAIAFQHLSEPLSVVHSLQSQVEGFAEYLHIIAKLRHPSIQDRHWESLAKTLNFQGQLENITLDDLVQSGVVQHLNRVEEICHRAGNEFAIEEMLNFAEVKTTVFVLDLKTDSDFPDLVYLAGLTETEEIIHELLATLKFVGSASKFTAHFKFRLDKLTNALVFSLQTLQDIIEMQENWRRLYPFLQLPEVFTGLEQDSELINDLHAFYTQQLRFIHSSQTLAFSTDLRVKSFVEANELLESLWKRMKVVLFKKAESYPRLYLLSDKEMSLLMTEIARGGRVGVSMLYPGLGDMSLTQGITREFKHADIPHVLDPPIYSRTGKIPLPPEQWLSKLDLGLQLAFKFAIFTAVESADTDQTAWWDAIPDPQVLLITQQILFSRDLFKGDRKEAVETLSANLKTALKTLIGEIRPVHGTQEKAVIAMFEAKGDLEGKFKARKKLEKLTLQVLNQIRVLNNVLENRLFQASDFVWQTIFSLEPQKTGRSFDLSVTSFDHHSSFGFEWLPLSLPLFVPTPISDRCMLNLVSTLKSGTSAVLHGPGGCGKSETLRELALMQGRYLFSWTVSENAHPSLTLETLTGCLGAGVWMCFEELNQLQSHLLATLAFYLSKARESVSSGAPAIVLDDRRVHLRSGFVFWGISTQTVLTLPPRVQECFRTVAMAQPDLAAVAETRLYALGIKETQSLGRKICQCLLNLSNPGSSISHNLTPKTKFMASVKVVHQIVDRIGSILDTLLIADSNYLVSNAFRRVLGVGLSVQEEVLFDELLASVFRAPHNNIVAGLAVIKEMENIKAVFDAKKMAVSTAILRGARHAWVSLTDPGRRLVVITGPAAAGKTAILNIVATAYFEANREHFSIPILSAQTSPLQLFQLFQNCINGSSSDLYHCLKGFRQAELSRKDWILIDTAGFWTDSLVSITRNVGFLQGEQRIEIPETMKIIVETENLDRVEPSVIAQISLVHCEEGAVTDLQVFQHAIETALPETSQRLMDLYKIHFDPLHEICLFSDPAISIPKKVSALALSNWLIMLLSPVPESKPRLVNLLLDASESQRKPTNPMDRTELESAWILSLINVLGSLLRNPLSFSQKLRELCESESPGFASNVSAFIREKSVLNVCDATYSFEGKIWVKWSDYSVPQKEASVPQLPAQADFVLIPTVSTKRIQAWTTMTTALHCDAVVIGPHQSGKTLIFNQVLRTRLGTDFASLIPVNILLSTTCSSIQHSVEVHMDQLQSRLYSSLGGRQHYVFLDDMNLDSDSVYDLLRGYKESGGWYWKGEFHTLTDVTFCLTHSYSEHRFRELNFRALRQFLLLYKDKYSEEEILTIFQTLSSHKLTTIFFQRYLTTAKDFLHLEQTWHHTTLSNYTQALKWLPTESLWTDMTRRYFADQQLGEGGDVFHLPEPVLPEVQENRVLNEDTFDLVMGRFHWVMSECEKKQPDSMKAVQKSRMRLGEALGKQVYLFSQIAGDLCAGQHCIVATRGDMQVLKAITLMAAETVGHQVVDIHLFDVGSELANSLASSNVGFLPTTVKFEVHRLINRAIHCKKSVCLVCLDHESNLSFPAFHAFMDLLSDVLLGKVIKSFVHTMKTADFSELYPDQKMQICRERIQENITVCFLVKAGDLSFNRTPETGVLESLKHDYRSLFNLCRLTNFDDAKVPKIILELVNAKEGQEDAGMGLVRKLVANLPIQIDDFSIERILHVANSMATSESLRLNTELAELQTALTHYQDLEQEMEKFTYLNEVQEKITEVRKRVHDMRRMNKTSHQVQNPEIEAVNVEKMTFLQKYETCMETLRRVLAQFKFEATSVSRLKSQYILYAALQTALKKSSTPFPFDQEELHPAYCKPIMKLLVSKSYEVTRALETLDVGTVPDLSEFLRSSTVDDLESPLGRVLVSIERAREISAELLQNERSWKERLSAAEESLASGSGTLDEELAELEEKKHQMLALKPKLVKFFNDINGMHREWEVRENAVCSRLANSAGTALLFASLLVTGHVFSIPIRDSIRSSVHHFLESQHIPFDKVQENKSNDTSLSSLFQEQKRACDWIWRLTLPYPVFFDPLGIAPEFLHDPKITTIQMWNPLKEVSEILESCVTQGKTLLMMEPSNDVLEKVMPLVRWRYNRSVEAARNQCVKTSPVMLGWRSIDVHTDFRLLISLPTQPKYEFMHMCTGVSLEPQDSGSWRASIFLPILKGFPPQRPVPDVFSPKDEIFHLFSTTPRTPIYMFPKLPLLLKMAEKLAFYEEKPGTTSEVQGPASVIDSLYSSLFPIVIELNDVLQSLNLGSWSMPFPMFRRLLLQVCEEQFQISGMPGKDQVSNVIEPIVYRLLVRLLWSLPVNLQYAVLLSYCLSRHCGKPTSSHIRELISEGLTQSFSTSEEVLGARLHTIRAKLPSLAEQFTERSHLFRNFVCKDLYQDAALPDTIDLSTQAVLVSWLRQDLLPQFVETLVVQVLGRRFSYLPNVDFTLVSEMVPSDQIVTVFFQDTDPLLGLKRAAAGSGAGLVYATPLVPSQGSVPREESRLLKVMKTVKSLCEEKKWLVLEGFESMEKAEVETMLKGISGVFHTKDIHPGFRLWILLHQEPKKILHWLPLVHLSFRVSFNDPQSVRERLILTQQHFSPALLLSMDTKSKQLYAEQSQTEIQFVRRLTKRVTRFNPILRSGNSRAKGEITPRGQRVSSFDDSALKGNFNDFLQYNLSLIAAFFDLRQAHVSEPSLTLSWKGIRQSISDCVLVLKNVVPDPSKDAVLSVVSLFLKLVGPAWDEFSVYAALNIMKHGLMSNLKSLKVIVRDVLGDSSVSYPLYHLQEVRSLESLMMDLPKQDLLQVVGLPHELYRQREHRRICKIAKVGLGTELRKEVPGLQEQLSAIRNVQSSLKYDSSDIDLATAYEFRNEERSKRFTYFFVPDRYRTNDFKSRVLSSIPVVSSVLSTLQSANSRQLSAFLKSVELQYTRILGYLTYLTAQISVPDEEIMRAVTAGKTPKMWKRTGPYGLQEENGLERYIGAISAPSPSYQEVISLKFVFDPPGLIMTLLRSLALMAQTDYEQVQFELSDDDGPLSQNSVRISDLYLYNASLKGYLLRDSVSTQPWAMSICRCTATTEYKELAESHPTPGGTVIYYRGREINHGEIEKEEKLMDIGKNAFCYPKPERIDGEHEIGTREKLNKVICPLFNRRTEHKFWVVFQSEQPQSHWSKRGIKVDIY